MLLIYSQFVLKNSIRGPLYLLNPPIIQEDQISLPRYTILHYLDTSKDNHFPNKDLNYLKDFPNNKKIPITILS